MLFALTRRQFVFMLSHTANPSPLQDPPCTTPLYSLCDMATNTIEGLAGSMELQLPTQYAGGIVLPRGLYRALDKTERGECSV